MYVASTTPVIYLLSQLPQSKSAVCFFKVPKYIVLVNVVIMHYVHLLMLSVIIIFYTGLHFKIKGLFVQANISLQLAWNSLVCKINKQNSLY